MFRTLFIKLQRLFGKKISEKDYIDSLQKAGIQIGYGLRISSPETTKIDYQNHQMITIGNNVRITAGCTILTHDYS